MTYDKIKFRKGAKSQLPILEVGEPGFCTDTNEFIIGGYDGNKDIVKDNPTFNDHLVKFTTVEKYGAVGDGIVDDTIKFQDAINDLSFKGGGYLYTDSFKTYGIAGTIKLKSNVYLYLRTSTLKRIGSETNIKMVQNYNFGNNPVIDKNLGVIGGYFVGTGDTVGVSDQGHALGFYSVDNLLLEKIETNNTNGDGIALRKTNNVKLRDIIIGDYGRNGISPTSGINIVWDNVYVKGVAITGANPGIPIDAENNNADETTQMFWNNVRASSVTFIDFHTEENGDFSHEIYMNNCKFTGKYPAGIRFKSTNKTVAKNVHINSNNDIFAASTAGSGILIDNVSGIKIDGAKLFVGTATSSPVGILIEGIVDSLYINNVVFNGFTRNISCLSPNEYNNAEIYNCNLSRSRVKGINNRFKGCRFSILELDSATTINNVFDSSCEIASITLVSSALISDQHFGSDRGSQSKTFYSRSVEIPDGATYDLVIPLPSAVGVTKGRMLFVFAGYSYLGRSDHNAMLFTTIRIGDTTQAEETQIAKSGTKDISILSVTTTAITLRLTYQYKGVFSATVLG